MSVRTKRCIKRKGQSIVLVLAQLIALSFAIWATIYMKHLEPRTELA